MYILLILLITSLHLSYAGPLMRIAHRGAPHFAPENTLASFEKAIELKSNFLELDVHQTKDFELVVLHDTKVDRTTNGHGHVFDITLQELQKLDAGGWFDQKFKDHKIPTLAPVLDLLIKNPQLKAIIELKDGDSVYPGMEKRVVDLITNKKLDSQVIFKSFDPEVLARLKKMAPDISSLYVFVASFPAMSLTINTSLAFHSALDVEAQILQIHYYFLTQSFVQKAHAKGYKVVAWGVETKKHMQKCLEMQVDGIETDRLDLLDEVTQNFKI